MAYKNHLLAIVFSCNALNWAHSFWVSVKRAEEFNVSSQLQSSRKHVHAREKENIVTPLGVCMHQTGKTNN